jgi:hypothetical protein
LISISSTELTSVLSNPENAAAIVEYRLSLTHIVILLEFVSRRLFSSGCDACLLLGSTNVVAVGLSPEKIILLATLPSRGCSEE